MVDLNHMVLINVPPEKVYWTVSTQAGMRSWWTADTKMEERVGGKAEFGFEKRQVVFRMTIERLDPAKCVLMRCHGDQPEWNDTTLRWEISKGETGQGPTISRFTHIGWRELTDYCIGCNSMWGNLMFRLKDAAEGRGRGPQWQQ